MALSHTYKKKILRGDDDIHPLKKDLSSVIAKMAEKREVSSEKRSVDSFAHLQCDFTFWLALYS